MKLRSYASILIYVAALSISGLAQSPAKVLKQAEKALGGAKALQSVYSVSKTGRIKRLGDEAEGKYVFQTSQPNLINESLDLGGFETETGCNGRSAWSRNSRDGLQTLTGKASLDLQAKASFRNNLWLNYKNEKSKITSGGQTVIDGKNANVVIITTQKGVVIKLYFDAASGLPLRDEIPNGDMPAVSDYSDYRKINGVKQPFATRVTLGGQVYEIHLDEVKINPSIDRSEFDFPVASNEPLPDIPALLQELRANEERVETILENYSFTQKTIMRELGKDGVLREKESETKQLTFYKGYHIKRLIEKDGKPLSEKDQVEADKDAAKQVEDIEKKLSKSESRLGKLDSKGAPSEDSRRISIAEVLRASKLSNARRERFRGRDCVVFDFEPNPDFDTKNATSILKFFGKTAGVMWIDEKDKQVARIEAVLFESLSIGGGVLAKFKKGASFTLEKERVNDEIWLPSQADINFSVRVLLVKGIDLNQVEKFYDYRKFETEVKDAKIDEITKP
jgi:hypothetical protein